MSEPGLQEIAAPAGRKECRAVKVPALRYSVPHRRSANTAAGRDAAPHRHGYRSWLTTNAGAGGVSAAHAVPVAHGFGFITGAPSRVPGRRAGAEIP